MLAKLPGAHVLQLADVQSTSLFVADATALAELAGYIGRDAEAQVLTTRATAMRAQLSRLWDPAQRTFADYMPWIDTFSTRSTPTMFYALFAGAATTVLNRVTFFLNPYIS